MTPADAHPPTSGVGEPRRPTRGRRAFLTASAAAVGAGVAATACQAPAAPPVAFDVIARNVQAKLSATADPQTNTDALNAALAESANGGTQVILPGGEFAFHGMTLPPAGRVSIRGSGRGVTVLRNEGTAPTVTAHGVPGNQHYMSDWAISDLTLDASTRRADQVALSVLLASRFSISDLYIRGHGVGVRHESSWDGGYDGVSVADSGVGWHFPPTNYAPTAPLGLRNCSAINTDRAVSIENGVEALEWIGGDFSGCGRGMSIVGDESRSISLHGINFERIAGEDLTVGDDDSGPAAIALYGCRFLRTDKGPVSVRFLRGDGLTFSSCRWTNYRTAVEHGDDAGLLVLHTSTGFDVDQFMTSRGQVAPPGVLNASVGPTTALLSLTEPSVLPAVHGTEGLATKVLSGPGRVSLRDDDFAITPVVGTTAVLVDEADGSVRQAIRVAAGWVVSAPYLPAT